MQTEPNIFDIPDSQFALQRESIETSGRGAVLTGGEVLEIVTEGGEHQTWARVAPGRVAILFHGAA